MLESVRSRADALWIDCLPATAGSVCFNAESLSLLRLSEP